MTLVTILSDKEMKLDSIQPYVITKHYSFISFIQILLCLFPGPMFLMLNLRIIGVETKCDNTIPRVHFTIQQILVTIKLWNHVTHRNRILILYLF